jgi:hypothetical protein
VKKYYTKELEPFVSHSETPTLSQAD